MRGRDAPRTTARSAPQHRLPKRKQPKLPGTHPGWALGFPGTGTRLLLTLQSHTMAFHCPHCTDEEGEAQRDSGPCLSGREINAAHQRCNGSWRGSGRWMSAPPVPFHPKLLLPQPLP